MDQSKTKIWRGGLAAITGGGEQDAPKPSQPLAATLVEVQNAPKPNTKPAPDLAVTRPDRGLGNSTRIMGSEELAIKPRQSLLARELSTTRVMPIETLLPKPTPTPAPRDASVTPIDLEPVQVPKRSLMSPKFLVPAFLLALAWLAASFLFNKPRVVAKPAPTRQSSAPQGIVASSAPVVPKPEAEPAPPSFETSQRPAKLERAAVDALIAGDYSQAERLYAQLARTARTPNPFSEARRILALRASPKRL